MTSARVRRAGASDVEVHRRYAPFWDVYYAVIVVAVTVALTFLPGQRPWRLATALAAIAAMAVLHVAAGRRLAKENAEDTRALVVLLGQVALYAVAVAADSFATWLLFVIMPLIFQLAAIRVAVALVVLANLVPIVVHLLDGSDSLLMDVVIAAVSSASASWLGFWIIRVIEQNVERGLLIAELEASRAEVARLSHEAGVGAERARLAGEIHDTLAQGFTSIVTLLQAADPELRDERLALAVRTARENLAEARALVAALSPSALAEGSLLDSVRRQAARFHEETGVRATVRTTGEERRLPTAVEVVLLRAAQEALTNVRRHAQAGAAAVLLAYEPQAVRLTVRDDGRGFVAGRRDGYGLTGMRARAGQVNGVLTVRSADGGGTTVELEVPA